jgi:DNA-binding MarR family transcriptional regulator
MAVDELCKKLRPVLGRQVDKLWELYQLEDQYGKQWIETILIKLLSEHLEETYISRKILLEPPPKERARGEYPLGRVLYGDKQICSFGLRENEFIQHIGIFGRSGSGKTNIAFLLLLNLLQKGKPFLVFDWKRNYRDLLQFFKKIFVFTVGREVSPFYFNPLIPPKGTEPKAWLKKLIEIICHAYFLGEGVAYLLQKALDNVYTEYGVYNGSQEYPTFFEVREWLQNCKLKRREADWLSSTLRAIGVLCFGGLGKVLNIRKTFPLEKLLEKNVILELDTLINSDKTFFIEALLLWIHHYRLAQCKREIFKHAIIIEEAHHVLLKKKQEITGEETIMDVILREIRELGESIIFLDQHPSLVSLPALGNTYTTITMNLKHQQDVNAISSAILLDYKDREYLGELEEGFGIVKLQGRWFKPFLVKFPLVPIKKGYINDKKLREKLNGLLLNGITNGFQGILLKERTLNLLNDLYKGIQTLYKKEETKSKVSMEEKGVLKALPEEIRDIRLYSPSVKEKKKITPEEAKLLQSIIDNPYTPIKERYRNLEMNSYKGNKIVNTLVQKGLIIRVRVKKPDSQIKLLKFTPEGEKVLRKLGYKIEKNWRKGSLEHCYWIEEIAKGLKKKGYKVEIEKPIGNGKTVDLAFEKDGERIAVEVETGKSDAIWNIQKDLKAGFDKVISVAIDRKVKEKIEKLIKESGLFRNKKVEVVRGKIENP